jgi:NTE family protein
MFSDKTLHNIQMSKAITYYLKLIDDLYMMLEDHFSSEKKKIKRSLKRSVQDTKKFQKSMGQKLRACII